MTAKKRLVTIKGVKDGLVFLMDDKCEFDSLLQELRDKMAGSRQKLFEGVHILAQVRLGNRYLDDKQQKQLREIIESKKNIKIRSFESNVVPKTMLEDDTGKLKKVQTIVRSGQTVHHDGDLLLFGDVNPGGIVTSTGDIYIMGSLRGMAHAGIDGNESSIVVASHMKPTQLRIAGVISRSPDEWGMEDVYMEFAYLVDGMMQIDKIANIGKVRSEGVAFKGE